MTYDLFFAGFGSGLIGALLGSWITYRFQLRLLEKQLASAKDSEKAFLISLEGVVQILAATNEGLKGQIASGFGQLVKSLDGLKGK